MSCEEGTAADMQYQLDSEGLRDLMMAGYSTLVHVTKAKDPLVPRKCDACAPPSATFLKGPLLAAFACMAIPGGAGRPIGVLGTLGKILASTSEAMRGLLVVNVRDWEGRMWGRGPPRPCVLAVRPPHNSFMAIGNAATMSKGKSDAIIYPTLGPEHAPMGDLRKDRSPGLHPLVVPWRRPHRRQPGYRHRHGCTSRAKALWATASGLVSRNVTGTHLRRHKMGTSVHQLVGNSRCLGASAASVRERQSCQWRLKRLQEQDDARRAAAAAAPGTRTPT